MSGRSIESFDEGFASGFARGEANALQLAVDRLRGSWDSAADLLEPILTEKVEAIASLDATLNGRSDP